MKKTKKTGTFKGKAERARRLYIQAAPEKSKISGISAFILISLALHLLLLGGAGILAARKKTDYNGSYMEVSFSYSPRKQGSAAKVEEKYAVNTEGKEGIEIKKKEENAGTLSGEQEKPSAAAGSIGPEESAFIDVLTVWKAEVRQRIRRALRYPKILREMNIEGVVVVDFTVDKSGYPQNIIVSATSGVKTLDDAAVRTVSRASPFPSPRDFGEEKYSVSIPIAFKLDKQTE